MSTHTSTEWFFFFTSNRLASNNNMSKSESDQEDNDDLNDNDWSYGAEKKGVYFNVILREGFVTSTELTRFLFPCCSQEEKVG